jgi:hypothetical protein
VPIPGVWTCLFRINRNTPFEKEVGQNYAPYFAQKNPHLIKSKGIPAVLAKNCYDFHTLFFFLRRQLKNEKN